MKSVSSLKPCLLETKFASSFSLLTYQELINLGAVTLTILFQVCFNIVFKTSRDFLILHALMLRVKGRKSTLY